MLQASRGLRVLQFYERPYTVGGAAEELRVGVAELLHRGHQVAVMCGSRDGPAPLPERCNVVVRPCVFRGGPAALVRRSMDRRRLLAIVTALSPDVIHLRGVLAPELLRWLAARWPTVYTAYAPICPNGARYRHRLREICECPVSRKCITTGFTRSGCGYVTSGHPISLAGFGRLWYRAQRLLVMLNKCQIVIAPSAWQARMLTADGVEGDRVVVVHPPADVAEQPRVTRGVIVVFVGRLIPSKGCEEVIRASGEIDVRHSVWIVGDGPERSRLEAVARDLGIAERVTFWGEVPPMRVGALVAHGAVVVVPSLAPETFNLVGAQAAARGQRVVVYDGGGIEEWAALHRHVAVVRHKDWRMLGARIRECLVADADHGGTRTLHFGSATHAQRLEAVYGNAITGWTNDQ